MVLLAPEVYVVSISNNASINLGSTINLYRVLLCGSSHHTNYLFHFKGKREAKCVVFPSHSLGDQHRVTKGTGHMERGVPKSRVILFSSSQTFVIIAK